jgi:hypothetical protein
LQREKICGDFSKLAAQSNEVTKVTGFFSNHHLIDIEMSKAARPVGSSGWCIVVMGSSYALGRPR